MYVGTAESLHARLTRSGKVRLKTYPFGKTAALLRAAQETGLLASLDGRIPRRQQAGLSVAQRNLVRRGDFTSSDQVPVTDEATEAAAS